MLGELNNNCWTDKNPQQTYASNKNVSKPKTDPQNLRLEVLAFLKNKQLNQVWYLYMGVS